MRLQDMKFAQALPPHVRSYISIRHPGYISGEDAMLALPCLDEISGLDETDAYVQADQGVPGSRPALAATHGVHFTTMLVACQIIAGNSFKAGYLSYDVQGSHRVALTGRGILTHGHYFLHVPQNADATDADATETTSYAVTPNFQEWRFPDRLPPIWQTVADTPRDPTTSCIITGRTRFEKAHVVPQAQEEWFTNNTMWEHAEGVDSASHSAANVCCLRPDLHKIFDDRTFALVPKLEADGRCHTVVHFFSTQNSIADVALRHHNRKVHSLDAVAPQFLFARFALTVFAYVKNFVLRGAQRQIAVVQRGIEPSGRPSWVTKVIDMDRAERHKRYGGGGSRASSPSKRSRPPSDYQRDASESVDSYAPAWEEDVRTAAWAAAAQRRMMSLVPQLTWI
ncbi:hypothetical protein G3M48_010138 [Beauveria asiatica]|uniref:HNH nuclease domain-containing protein n=1 Tax=Beauveria asiatica TaxID=1069075 RepID=A0AAW0RHW8_9HYPO